MEQEHKDPRTFGEICDDLKALQKRKNADYGSVFSNSVYEYGLTAVAIRLSDKLNRFKTLLIRKALVKDESMIDTLTDLAAYALMAVEYIENNYEED